MTDYAEASVKLKNLHKEADDCERHKMYEALVVELDEMGQKWREMYEWALAKRSEQMQESVKEAA
jgi:hypothetical protein